MKNIIKEMTAETVWLIIVGVLSTLVWYGVFLNLSGLKKADADKEYFYFCLNSSVGNSMEIVPHGGFIRNQNNTTYYYPKCNKEEDVFKIEKVK